MQDRPDRLVIYDIDHPPFMANQAFDATQMSQYPGASAIVALAERLGESGVGMVTADARLASGARHPSAGAPRGSTTMPPCDRRSAESSVHCEGD